MSGYERPSAKGDLPQEHRVAFHGRLEAPDPNHEGRFVVTLSPLFPFEADVRRWAHLFVSKGEVRVWRREFTNGRFVRDVELSLLEAVREA